MWLKFDAELRNAGDYVKKRRTGVYQGRNGVGDRYMGSETVAEVVLVPLPSGLNGSLIARLLRK
jgi:hypothetical protein